MKPRVSVIMPAFNCGPYIEEAIRSVLNQTFSDLELLICDDGSTDNTWDVISSFSDARIKKHQHHTNRGYLETYNFLLTLPQGDYVTFQDADDWSDKRRLEVQVAALEKFPEVSMSACNGVFYYSRKIQRPCPPLETGLIRLDANNFQFMLPSTMIRREVLLHVKGFHQYFAGLTGGDQYFILEILCRFKGYQINEYHYYARFNPTSNHRTLNEPRKLSIPDAYFLLKRQRVATGSDWLMEGKEDELLQYEQSLLDNRKFLAEKLREYAAFSIDSNLFGAAISLLWKSWKKNPFWPTTYRTIFYWLRKQALG